MCACCKRVALCGDVGRFAAEVKVAALEAELVDLRSQAAARLDELDAEIER